jgi:AcrR family transcriptional regulator
VYAPAAPGALDLIAEDGSPGITVQDLPARADVGRSTLYAHYRDKDDLLRGGVAGFETATAARIERSGGRKHRAMLSAVFNCTCNMR